MSRDLPYWLIVQCVDCQAYAAWLKAEERIVLEHRDDCPNEPLNLKVGA